MWFEICTIMIAIICFCIAIAAGEDLLKAMFYISIGTKIFMVIVGAFYGLFAIAIPWLIANTVPIIIFVILPFVVVGAYLFYLAYGPVYRVKAEYALKRIKARRA